MPVAPVGLAVLVSLAALGPDAMRGGGGDLRAPARPGAPLLRRVAVFPANGPR